MITWGIISGLTALVWNDWSFHIIRFMLGVAEAGFFPGMLLYLTWWFPERYSSRMIATLYTAAAGSMIIGPPLGGLVLWMNGLLGMHGWQWLFIMEALPAVIMCFVTLWLLTDKPADAAWLRPDQKAWLILQLEEERRVRDAQRKYSLCEIFSNRKVLFLSLAYHTHSAAGALLMFFMPLIVKGLGVPTNWIGTVSAIPFVFALVAMLICSWHSDRTGDRVWHVICGWVLGAAAMAAAVLIGPDQPLLMMAALIVATATNQACAAVFWPIPSALMTGAAAAASLAMINSIGQLGGWFGPWLFGWIRDLSGSDRIALLWMSLGPIISCFALLGAINDHWFTRTPSRSPHDQEAVPHAR
jgi:MFS family permease